MLKYPHKLQIILWYNYLILLTNGSWLMVLTVVGFKCETQYEVCVSTITNKAVEREPTKAG